jgi:hypothetical protein
VTLPPTKNAKIDRNKLKKAIAQSNLEMEKYVTTGFMPIFGYQLVCYSPTVNKEEEEPTMKKSDVKETLYNSIMKKRDGSDFS